MVAMGTSPRRLLASLSVFAFVAVSCGGSSGRSVTLTATSSTSDDVEVSYEIDGTVVSETVNTPWSQAVEVSGEFDLSLMVTNPSDTGDVGCAVDGLGIGPPVAATGEVAASCAANGLISSSSSSITSSARGTPRAADATGTETADAASTETASEDAGDADGIVAELVIVDASAVPTELTQFGSFDVSLRVSGLDISGDESVIVDGVLAYEWPTVTSDVSASELYGVDDVVDGTLAHRLTGRSLLVANDAGRYMFNATGTISVPEQGIETPFDLSLDVDVAAVEVELVTTEFLDGALVFDVPNSFQVNELSGWGATAEQELGIERPVDVDILDRVIEISSRDGSAGVLVLRSTRPLSHPDLAVAAQQLSEALPLPESIAPATIGGVESQRIEISDGASTARLDVFRLGGELFVIQASDPVDDPSGSAEAAAIADSVVFDLDAIPRLTHTVVVTTSSNDGPDLGSYDIPADWMQGPSTFSSSDGLVGARLGFVAGEESVDAVIALVVEEAGYLNPATNTELDGVDFAELGADDDLGIRRDFVGAVPGGVLVFTVFDERPEVDALLVDAIVESLTVIAR